MPILPDPTNAKELIVPSYLYQYNFNVFLKMHP